VSRASSAPTTSIRQAQLDRNLVHGIAWIGAVKWVAQGLSWVSVLVLARLLSPGDYGLVGMANVYIGLVSMINEFGIGATVIAQRDLAPDQVAHMNGLALVVGALCTVVSCVAAFPVAWFYGVPQLRWVVIALSATFAIYSLRTVPQALLSRELKYPLLAKIEGLQVILQALCTVTLAALGLGYWALVLGTISAAVIGTALTCIARPPQFAFPHIKSIPDLFTFSRRIVVGRIAWYVQTNADFLMAGRLLGKTALGFYTFAWTLASLPIDKVTAFIHPVTFPLFSSVQSDRASLQRYLVKLTEFLSLIGFPIAAGLAVVAPEFVLVTLGEKWLPAVVPLQLLAVGAVLRVISPLLAQVLLVTGEPGVVMNLSIAGAISGPIAFYLGSFWGTAGIASGWLVIHPLLAVAAYRRTFQKIGMNAVDYLPSLWPALGATCSMAAALIILKRILPITAKMQLLVLSGEVLIGAAVYVGFLLVFHRRRLHTFLQFLLEMRRMG
jgi:O-antigen/teichoic acid export membrane protein